MHATLNKALSMKAYLKYLLTVLQEYPSMPEILCIQEFHQPRYCKALFLWTDYEYINFFKAKDIWSDNAVNLTEQTFDQ